MTEKAATPVLRVLAHRAHSLGDFISRPDLNADNIRLIDQVADGLERVSETVTALLDAWDALIPVVEDELSVHPQAAALYSALTKLAELEGRRAPVSP